MSNEDWELVKNYALQCKAVLEARLEEIRGDFPGLNLPTAHVKVPFFSVYGGSTNTAPIGNTTSQENLLSEWVGNRLACEIGLQVLADQLKKELIP